MPQFTKLDKAASELLCCPFCKGNLTAEPNRFKCSACHAQYPLVEVLDDRIWDFRIHHPAYVVPASVRKWEVTQDKYEKYVGDFSERDNLQEYLNEIEAVKEIYADEFHLRGDILDVGGHQGRLRHHLSKKDVSLYISVDPFAGSFRDANKPNLLKAYSCLLDRCNFLSCNAENLPFAAASFDWVHMRSVVDHFADPYAAMKEAYRVLKPNGQLLIGLAIEERMLKSGGSIGRRVIQKLQGEGIIHTLKAIGGKVAGDHNFRLGYADLLDLLSIAGFQMTKEYWQKPPFTYVAYLSAQKSV